MQDVAMTRIVELEKREAEANRVIRLLIGAVEELHHLESVRTHGSETGRASVLTGIRDKLVEARNRMGELP